jgi:hypothetical protein
MQYASFKASASLIDGNLECVFTDFKPNLNKQGVPREESANIINSAIHRPVKMNLSSKRHVHAGSIPVGPIVSANLSENGESVLIAAKVWSDEYPTVDKYLRASVQRSKPVDFSWELFYKYSTIDDDGVEWLRDVTVGAITIVDSPSYDGRTPLLTYAEFYGGDPLEDRIEILEEAIKSLKASLDQLVDSAASTDNTVTATDNAVSPELQELRRFKVDTLAKEAAAKRVQEMKSVIESQKLESVMADVKLEEITQDYFNGMVEGILSVRRTDPVNSETRYPAMSPVSVSNKSVSHFVSLLKEGLNGNS